MNLCNFMYINIHIYKHIYHTPLMSSIFQNHLPEPNCGDFPTITTIIKSK